MSGIYDEGALPDPEEPDDQDEGGAQNGEEAHSPLAPNEDVAATPSGDESDEQRTADAEPATVEGQEPPD